MNNYEELDNSIRKFSYRIIDETKNFFCVPSLGQIVPGYCLIFPKFELINFKLLSKHYTNELLEFKHTISNKIETLYSQPIIFEHGATEYNSKASCGVNIAHLHLVPYKFHKILIPIQKKYRLRYKFNSLKDFISYKIDIGPYILIGHAGQPFMVFEYGKNRESQVVRKIIWNNESPEMSWDWKKSPTIKKTLETYNAMKNISENEF